MRSGKCTKAISKIFNQLKKSLFNDRAYEENRDI